jgi:rhodanese-related sulfurtransferase
MKAGIRIWLVTIAVLFSMALTACGSGEKAADGNSKENSYRQVSQEEAQKMMDEETDYIILDVRTQEEYASGHIPGAICIPNETIGTDPIEELPDKDQLILVYCRSGNRSKQAAGKLADQGYTNIVEFGGINTWTGNIVTE